VPNPFTIRFASDHNALAAEPSVMAELPAALNALGLAAPRPVLVLVGGAAGLDAGAAKALERLFREVVAPLIEALGAAVVDGGTDAGVMALMGRARAAGHAAFPLVGVAPLVKVGLPGQPDGADRTPLEPNHSQFLLVPGEDWGAESPWIAAAAAVLAGARGRVTLVAGGGRVTGLDVEASLAAGTPTLVLTGSGGTANTLALALRDGSSAYPQDGPASIRCLELASAAQALPDLMRSLLAA
jgi:hypothetical protein